MESGGECAQTKEPMANSNDHTPPTEPGLPTQSGPAASPWRRGGDVQELIALLGGFVLLLLLTASTITGIIQPVFPLAALVFFLYPFRKAIVPRRTIQLGILTFLVWLFLNLSGVLAPFIIAFVIAYLFSPLVSRVERMGVPRWVTAVGITLGMLGLYAVVGIFVVPGLIDQMQQLLSSADGLFKGANSIFDRGYLESQLESLGIPHAQAHDIVVNEIEPQLKATITWLFTNLGTFLKNATTILEGVVNLLLIPLLSLYLMIDFNRLRGFIRSKVLRDNPGHVYYIRQVDLILSSYIRGILITSSLVGAVAVGVLSILDVPYAVVIGILTGVFNLIPSVGIFMNLGVAMLIFVFAPGNFLLNTVITAAMVFGLHALNAYVVEPRVIGDRVGLPPVVMIASLFVFAHFLGFIGLLIAVPLAAVIGMFLKEWYRSNVTPAQSEPGHP